MAAVIERAPGRVVRGMGSAARLLPESDALVR